MPRGVSEIFHAIEASKRASAPIAANLKAQVDVMKDISQFHYMQFPIMLNNRQTQTELYVMKREAGGRKIDPEDTTLVVALDTENMGRVESIMRVMGRNVSIRMRCPAGVVPYMRAHTIDMHALLRDEGYKMVDMNVSPLTEPITPLNVEERISENIGRYQPRNVLDLRA